MQNNETRKVFTMYGNQIGKPVNNFTSSPVRNKKNLEISSVYKQVGTQSCIGIMQNNNDNKSSQRSF